MKSAMRTDTLCLRVRAARRICLGAAMTEIAAIRETAATGIVTAGLAKEADRVTQTRRVTAEIVEIVHVKADRDKDRAEATEETAAATEAGGAEGAMAVKGIGVTAIAVRSGPSRLRSLDFLRVCFRFSNARKTDREPVNCEARGSLLASV